jgi:hypothetical protein
MGQEIFPIPGSGQTRTIPGTESEFTVECAGINKTDHDRLEGFFARMQGPFGEFRFEYAGIVCPKCRFDSDTSTFSSGPVAYSVAFPIQVLSNY